MDSISAAPDLLARARQAAAATPARCLGADTLAEATGTSTHRLRRACAHAGSTLREEVANARLAAAAELLATQPLAVDLVARLSGYRGRAAFTRAFTRRYGLSPAAFRTAARRASRPGDAPPGPRRPSAVVAVSSPTTTATDPSS